MLLGYDIESGKRAKLAGLSAKHPVVIVPGIVSSGLELWRGKACMEGSFRKRIWGSMSMIKMVASSLQCWMEHMSLVDGRDPDGIVVRAAEGLGAADFLFPGFWVWGSMIENLAQIGYVGNDNLIMAPYDWRVSPSSLEERDGYFSKLQAQIEIMVKRQKSKAVLLAHSLGGTIALYFLQFVAAQPDGEAWLSAHIHAVTGVGAAWLGAPKTLSALLSGEMKDTADLGALETYAVNKLVTREDRKKLMRSWSGLAALLPKGGDPVWGDEPFVQFADGTPNMSATDSVQRPELAFLGHYEHGLDLDAVPKERRWSNPLLDPLPNSSVKIICLYGVGKATESRYHYHLSSPGHPLINTSMVDAQSRTEHGIVHGEGDGTVPLASLGYMCVEGWKPGSRLNPSENAVVTREYKHLPDKTVRGGSQTADHVDILGNHDMTDDLLRLVSGQGLESRIESTVREESEVVRARLDAMITAKDTSMTL